MLVEGSLILDLHQAPLQSFFRHRFFVRARAASGGRGGTLKRQTRSSRQRSSSQRRSTTTPQFAVLRVAAASLLLLLVCGASGGMRVLVTGSSRGIGLGLTRALLEHAGVSQVVATARRPSESPDLMALAAQPEYSGSGKLVVLPLDVTDAASHAALASSLDALGITAIDIAILNHGISNPAHPVDPLLTASEEDLMAVYRTNVVGTVLALQALTPRLTHAQSGPRLCCLLSSAMASVERAAAPGSSGGSVSYRCSKAALNMLAATWVAEPAVKTAGARCLLLHPGWVQTDMGGAGGRRAAVTVEQSCAGLLRQIMRAAAGTAAGAAAGTAAGTAAGAAAGAGGASGSEPEPEFERQLRERRLVFASFEGELLPF